MLHELLKQSAGQFSRNIAVSDNTNALTYSQLNTVSSNLAKLLQTVYDKCDRTVLVYSEKCVFTVAAFLGVLELGAAYVPLDPSNPEPRLIYIANNTESKILIIDIRWMELGLKIAQHSHIKWIVSINPSEYSSDNIPDWQLLNVSEGTWFKGETNSALFPLCDNTLPAYILYTSGSTGKPKGVVISHQSAECFINWACEYFQLTEHDILSSHAPFSFDLSIFDIFSTLKVGAHVCLLPRALSAFPSSLIKYICNKRITTWYSVPSVLIDIINSKNDLADIACTLSRVIYAGEKFPSIHLQKLMQSLPNTRFYNLYGPTETNVVTYYEIKPFKDSAPIEIPIGTPCPYAEIQVIDEQKNTVAEGMIGELIVHSTSMMDGYLGVTDNESNHLLSMPGGNDCCKQFYRTGDIVKILPNRLLLYLSRKDTMVKLNGFRVELGEIEHTTLQLSGVIDCACVAIKDKQKDTTHLHLFLTTESINTTEAEIKIKNHLKHYLPSYMQPQKILLIDSIPRTTNGKINYKQLQLLCTHNMTVNTSS